MSDGVRVLYVIHQLGAASDGGLQSVGELLARTAPKAAGVITNLDSGHSRRWRELVPVLVRPMSADSGKGLRRGMRMVANNWRVLIEVRRRHADVVHANDHRAFLDSAYGAKLGGAKVLFNVRDSFRHGASPRRWRTYLRWCDRFLVLSREMESRWKADLAPLSHRQEEKISYLYSIVDPGTFHPMTSSQRGRLRAGLGIPAQEHALAYVGRVEEKKGQLRFIREAMPALAATRADVAVYFIGDCPPETDEYAAACRAAAGEIGVSDRVRFVGHRDDIADWYRAADLILIASTREGLARSMIEGLACGTPVVSFDVCSAQEVLEANDCGKVVPQGDYAGLVRETLALLDDRTRRRAYAEAGPRVAARMFDPVSVAAAYAALVQEIAA